MSESVNKSICRHCRGAKTVTVRKASGQTEQRSCPACGGSGTKGLVTK